jgi:hypothetical protein
MSTTLNLLTPPAKHSKGTGGMSSEKFERLTVVQQVIHAFKPGGRVAAFIGLLTGGCIPAFTFCVAHFVLPFYRFDVTLWSKAVVIAMWGMVGGGLACSAPKVYTWFLDAYGKRLQAVGAMLCLECVMTFAPIFYLSAAALAMLVFVNSMYCACRLQVRK